MFSSTPFALSDGGSGAFKQACTALVTCLRQCDWDAAYLDEVLAFGLRDEWLELRGREGVDEAGFGDDEQQYLGAGEDG